MQESRCSKIGGSKNRSKRPTGGVNRGEGSAGAEQNKERAENKLYI